MQILSKHKKHFHYTILFTQLLESEPPEDQLAVNFMILEEASTLERNGSIIVLPVGLKPLTQGSWYFTVLVEASVLSITTL